MYDAYKYLGCHFDKKSGSAIFRVWSTRANYVSVVGDFNGWDVKANPMKKITEAGLWETRVQNVKPYDNYKYYNHIALVSDFSKILPILLSV